VKVCDKCGACFEDRYEACGYDGASLSASFPGKRVLGDRYLLEQRIDAGAMGEVFRAAHLQVGSTVAVKMMLPRREGLRVGLQRFHREAQILGQIKHPNAVLVIDFGVEERADARFPYLVTEYLRGAPLSARLEGDPRLSVSEVERIVAPLCEAVEEAHEVGVIHRDIKPSNIFLEELRDGSEVVKVLDFGIAKFVELTDELLQQKRLENARWALEYAQSDPDLLEEVAQVRAGDAPTTPQRLRSLSSSASSNEPRPETITEAGFMIGTIPYMAPEQMTGEGVSRQTDVYAVATVVFQLLAGRLPFAGGDDEIVTAKVTDDPPSLRELGVDVSEELDLFLQRALAMEPVDRPESVMAVAQALALAHEAMPPAVDSQDVAGRLDALVAGLDRLSLTLESFGLEGDVDELYEQARDRFLSLDRSLAGARAAADGLGAPLDAAEQALLGDALLDVRSAQGRLTRALHGASTVAAEASEYVDYLAALWSRANGRLETIASDLEERTGAADTKSAPHLSADQLFAAPELDTDELAALTRRLESADALERSDALDELLCEHSAQIARVLDRSREGDERVEALARALWPCADALVWLELYPCGQTLSGRPLPSTSVRLLPRLHALPRSEATLPFHALSSVFSSASDPAASASALERALEEVGEARADMLWRCLLAHPLPSLRELAVAALQLADFWNAISHPATPLAAVLTIFRRVQSTAPPEYLTVFFLCLADRLRNPGPREDLQSAFALLLRFFDVPNFHEDVVFEPLLEVDRVLRERAASQRLKLDDEAGYETRLRAFLSEGARQSKPPENLRDVPLPLQRKLARDGHFLPYFVCHAVEGLARETLPHLLRLDDVTRFLRLPRIHRAVLVELSKRRRFFRKDEPRLALLHNPKTPAPVARPFLPILSLAQLRRLAQDRSASAEVRQLASGFADRLERRRRL
jgi:serine/threonine-protein kinase